MGVKDIGFGITVSDRNAKDLLELYHLSKMMKLEFASAAIHNAYYFHKFDNTFHEPEMVKEEFKKVVEELLKSRRVKNWFRAYFNYGLMQYIDGKPRLLPCGMGQDSFFVDPGVGSWPVTCLTRAWVTSRILLSKRYGRLRRLMQ